MHFVFGECACFIAKDLCDLPQVIIQIGRLNLQIGNIELHQLCLKKPNHLQGEHKADRNKVYEQEKPVTNAHEVRNALVSNHTHKSAEEADNPLYEPNQEDESIHKLLHSSLLPSGAMLVQHDFGLIARVDNHSLDDRRMLERATFQNQVAF